jgi:hypothetical protein
MEGTNHLHGDLPCILGFWSGCDIPRSLQAQSKNENYHLIERYCNILVRAPRYITPTPKLYGKRTKAFALTIVSVIKADGGGLGRYMHNGRDNYKRSQKMKITI